MPCNYCGDSLTITRKAYNMNGPYTHNGIDRVNNDRGYEPNNVVACCEICNRMKLTLSKEEFLNHVQKIHEWRD